MSTNGLTPSFRLPLNIEGKADPDVVEALQYHDDAITDLQQSIPSLKSQIDDLSTTVSAATTENVSESSETVITETSTIGMVNDQTGNTSYATQQTDYGAFILFSDASPIAVTLTQGTEITVPWYAVLINEGVGLITVTPATGTISYPGNLSAASMPIPQNTAAIVCYDGSDFEAILLPISPANTPQVTSEWLNSFDSTTGVFGQSQPAFSDISGVAAPAQLPIATDSALGIVEPDGTTITITGGGVITAVPQVTFGSGAPSGSAATGALYFDTSTSPYTGYVYNGSWEQFA